MLRLRRSAAGYWTTVAMLGIVIVPAALTLLTVRSGASEPQVSASASPYGYTVSLLMFIVPSFTILFWFLPREGLSVSKRALGSTIGLLFPLGVVLDFFFARFFFVFPNPAATLGIKAPALGNWVPVEEYIFYLMGFLTAVLLYVWLDEYWLAAYTVPASARERTDFDRLLRFHPASSVMAAALIAGAFVYQGLAAHTGSDIPHRFPGYFIFLVLFALLPSSVLLPMARPVINWRALSLTMFMLLVTSLMWEVTLALPYGWWNFRNEQMLGIRVVAWSRLPIEEVYVWIAVTYASVTVYEIVKRWKSSGRPAAHAFFGARSDEARAGLAQAPDS